MAGELWRPYLQIGKETTPGTAVAATRRMYFDKDNSRLSRERDARPHRFATGSRDNVRAFTLGPVQAGGSVKMPLSASEIIELLLMGINGGVTPTGAGTPKVWTFTPGNTLDPATVEWYDGARGWEAAGAYVNKLQFQGSVNGENSVMAELFAMSLTQSTPTGSLSERTPDFIEGWETAVYIDDIGDTPGTTQVTGTLINWDVSIENQLGRKYFAANTLNAGGIPIGELEVKAKLTFEAAPAGTLTEYDNWDAATQRLVRLEFGQNEVIDGSDKKYVMLDLPGAWESVDIGGTDEGTRTYEFNLQYIYDVTNAFGLQIIAQNARSSAWS